MTTGGVKPDYHGIPRRTRCRRARLTHVVSGWGTVRAARAAHCAKFAETAAVSQTEVVPASKLARQVGTRTTGARPPAWLAWVVKIHGPSVDWGTYFALNRPVDRGISLQGSSNYVYRRLTVKERIYGALQMITVITIWSFLIGQGFRDKHTEFLYGQISRSDYLHWIWEGSSALAFFLLLAIGMISYCIWPALFEGWAKTIKEQLVRVGWLAEQASKRKER